MRERFGLTVVTQALHRAARQAQPTYTALRTVIRGSPGGRDLAHGTAVARGHVLTRLLAALDRPGPSPAMRRFAAHLSTKLPALLSLLYDPAVDATNWRAEHAIRPAVVNRTVCGGNRSPRGADTQQVLASVIRTARQRGLHAGDVVADLLRVPHPIASPALHSASPR